MDDREKIGQLEIDRFLAQAELLGRLLTDPSWEAYEALLVSMRQAYLEEMARCTEPHDFRLWQGAALAIAETLDRPKRIVARAAAHQQAEEDGGQVIRTELRAALGYGVEQEETI